MKNATCIVTGRWVAILALGCSFFWGAADARGDESAKESASTVSVVIHLDQLPKPISPDLFGIFFEDLNYAADGGLYAEMVRLNIPRWSVRSGMA
jgi:hypothetical protein